MYDINLIRSRDIPQRQKNVVFSLLMLGGLVYVLTIVAIVVFAVSSSRTVAVYACEVEALRESVGDALGGRTPARGELESTMKQMKPELDNIEKMLKGRTDIASLWTGIAGAVPDSVWLTSVRVSPPRARLSSGRKRGGRSNEGNILLEGAVAAGIERGGELIREFAQGLEERPELGDRITDARAAETGVRRIGGKDVIGFEIICPMR